MAMVQIDLDELNELRQSIVKEAESRRSAWDDNDYLRRQLREQTERAERAEADLKFIESRKLTVEWKSGKWLIHDGDNWEIGTTIQEAVAEFGAAAHPSPEVSESYAKVRVADLLAKQHAKDLDSIADVSESSESSESKSMELRIEGDAQREFYKGEHDFHNAAFAIAEQAARARDRDKPRITAEDAAAACSQLVAAQRQVAEDAKLWEWMRANAVAIHLMHGTVDKFMAQSRACNSTWLDSPRASVLALMEQMEKGK